MTGIETILYSAPEVVGTSLRGRGGDTRYAADIYSLGVLLYHLLTSRLPHETLSQVARHTPFPRPTEINSTICSAVEEYILRALHAEPADRWLSVNAMQEALPNIRRSQRQYQPIRAVPAKAVESRDWASFAVQLMSAGENARAEAVARQFFEQSRDAHAFLCMVSAAA